MDEKCFGCDRPLNVRWTDTHGVAACAHCGMPHRLYHYEGEGDASKRVERPPSCPVYEEWIAIGRRYHAETGGCMFPGSFDLGIFRSRGGRTYSGATEEDMRLWDEWLETHKAELPPPREHPRELPGAAMKPPCTACKHCGIEPDDMNPTCHHPEITAKHPFGLHVMTIKRAPGCGEEGKLFEQHPGRTAKGHLKQSQQKGARR